MVAKLDCADRVCKMQTATSITAIVANVVLTEFEFTAHSPFVRSVPDNSTPIVHHSREDSHHRCIATVAGKTGSEIEPEGRLSRNYVVDGL